MTGSQRGVSLRRRPATIARAIAGVIAVGALSGCVPLMQAKPDFAADDLPALATVAPTGQRGGVFNPVSAWSLASDGRAYRPGDTLTVTLEETTQASKRADSSFGKRSDVSVKPSTMLGKTLPIDTSLGADRNFKGGGATSQQNSLRGEITVIVHEVLPSGLLKVKGEKTLALNQGEEIMRLAGYVRPADIDTNNRVSSRRMANARIQYAGRGALSDATGAGWLTRALTSPWMPF